MKPKQKIKISVDVAMTIAFFLCMAYHLTSKMLHEWLGVTLFALFAVHHLLNLGWYKALFKGTYSPLRFFHTTVNMLLLAAILCMIISGVMLSQQVFSFLGLSPGTFGRKLHMASCSWGFVLTAVHLGFHWGMVLGKLKNNRLFASVAVKMAMRFAALAVSIYGGYAFFARQVAHKMLLLVDFAFLNYGEAFALFLLDYIAVFVLFTCAIFYFSNALKHKKEIIQ